MFGAGMRIWGRSEVEDEVEKVNRQRTTSPLHS